RVRGVAAVAHCYGRGLCAGQRGRPGLRVLHRTRETLDPKGHNRTVSWRLRAACGFVRSARFGNVAEGHTGPHTCRALLRRNAEMSGPNPPGPEFLGDEPLREPIAD